MSIVSEPANSFQPSTLHMVNYDQNSSVQDRIIHDRAVLLNRIVKSMEHGASPFVIADLGCGPGRSAISAVRPSIDTRAAIDRKTPIVVRHGDQKDNDWNGLMALVHGPAGYMRDDVDLRVEMAVGNFYKPMAAPGTVSLTTCFTASHWSSRALRMHTPGTLFFSDLRGRAFNEMKALADSDWSTFLHARAGELREGGHLVVSTLGSQPDPDEPNGFMASARKLYRAMYAVLQGMADDRLIAQVELDDFVFPLWFPSVEDMNAPLKNDSVLANAFEIVETTVEPLSGGWEDAFVRDIGDPVRYGALYAGYTRGFAETTLQMHLFDRVSRSKERSRELTEIFFERFADLFAREPGAHAFETLIATQVLRRKPC